MLQPTCRSRLHILALLLSGLLMLLSAEASAASIESVIMPGEVIQGHAKYETDCSNCHERFKKGGQKDKCLACHKDINKDIRHSRGFHGKRKAIRLQDCSTCHTDHAGRKADIIKFDPLTFDHRLTDFLLNGEHTRVTCSRCHKQGKKYREAPSSCYSCHKQDSPHKASDLGVYEKKCETCHGTNKWHQAQHKHRRSKFPRGGKHRDLACRSCHVTDKYEHTATACYSCHQADDQHRGANGKKCQKCHSTRGWNKLAFDHAKDTEFPLRGRHETLRCASCHKKDPYRVKIKKTCVSCHKHDDSHQGRNGSKCETCHREQAWNKPIFDHNRKTKFKLKGRHSKLACVACHKQNVYKHKPKKDCYSCHRIDDAHKGQQGKKCNNCHNESGWHNKVRFEHDITRFPLVGLHAVVPCEECHINNNYQDASIACNSCHAKDDVHKRRLGENCQRCHNPNGWSIWRFNHNKQSEFKLDGAHKKVHCHSCHATAVRKVETTPRTCLACHRTDDEHNGQFGARCDQCHNTRSFSDVRILR